MNCDHLSLEHRSVSAKAIQSNFLDFFSYISALIPLSVLESSLNQFESAFVMVKEITNNIDIREKYFTPSIQVNQDLSYWMSEEFSKYFGQEWLFAKYYLYSKFDANMEETYLFDISNQFRTFSRNGLPCVRTAEYKNTVPT